MAKSVTIGAMNARITVKRITRGIDSDGFNTESETDVFGQPIYANWVWQHGTQAFTNNRLELGQTATVTTRYSPQIDQRCRIYLCSEGSGAEAFEIISIDNVGEGRRFMEMAMKRKVKA